MQNFKFNKRSEKMSLALNVISANNYSLETLYKDESNTEVYSNIEDALQKIKDDFETEQNFKLYLLFSSKLSFQEYITNKSKIQNLEDEGIPIEDNEFIY